MPVSGKGKGKAHAAPKPPLPIVETMSPSSLKALLADSTLFEDPPLKDPKEEVMAETIVVYGAEMMKKDQDLLRDYTPFQTKALVTLTLCLI